MAFAGHQHDYAAGANEKDTDIGGGSKLPVNHDEFASLETAQTDQSRIFQPPILVRQMSPERRIEAEAALKRKIGMCFFC